MFQVSVNPCASSTLFPFSSFSSFPCCISKATLLANFTQHFASIYWYCMRMWYYIFLQTEMKLQFMTIKYHLNNFLLNFCFWVLAFWGLFLWDFEMVVSSDRRKPPEKPKETERWRRADDGNYMRGRRGEVGEGNRGRGLESVKTKAKWRGKELQDYVLETDEGKKLRKERENDWIV